MKVMDAEALARDYEHERVRLEEEVAELRELLHKQNEMLASKGVEPLPIPTSRLRVQWEETVGEGGELRQELDGDANRVAGSDENDESLRIHDELDQQNVWMSAEKNLEGASKRTEEIGACKASSQRGSVELQQGDGDNEAIAASGQAAAPLPPPLSPRFNEHLPSQRQQEEEGGGYRPRSMALQRETSSRLPRHRHSQMDEQRARLQSDTTPLFGRRSAQALDLSPRAYSLLQIPRELCQVVRRDIGLIVQEEKQETIREQDRQSRKELEHDDRMAEREGEGEFLELSETESESETESVDEESLGTEV